MRRVVLARLAGTLAVAFFISIGCGGAGAAVAPAAAMPPITLGDDLTQVDVCAAIPREQVEAAMERSLSKAPKRFEYPDAAGSSGCWYEAATDGHDEAHFGYVAFAHIDAYNNQPMYENQDVADLGQAAYFNNGADARQLWVKVDEETALVVAFGDVPREESCLQLAALILAAVEQ